MIFLESERLLFRSHEAVDQAAFVAMQMDPDVRRYVGGRPWSEEKALYRFQHQFLGEPSKVFGLWATICKSSGEYIGYCGLNRRYDRSRRRAEKEASLAYYIAKPHWRRGYATEACVAFIHHGFEGLGLKAIFADVEQGNDPSEHILQKLGFTLIDREEIPNRIFLIYRLSRDAHERLTGR